MKIKNLLLIACLCFNVSFFAQTPSEDFEIAWSNHKKYKNTLKLIGAKKTDEGYLVFNKETIKGPGGWRYFIESYDNKMNFIRKFDISEQVDEKNYRIQDIINYGDDFLLISTRVFKKEKRKETYIQKIGESQSNIIGKRVKINNEVLYKKKGHSSYHLTTSPNDKYLLFQIIPYYSKKHPENMSLILLDEDLKIYWEEEKVEVLGISPDGKLRFQIKNIVLNDLGEVFIIGKEGAKTPYSRHLYTGSRIDLYEDKDQFYKIYKLVEGNYTGESITLDKQGLKRMDIQVSKNNTLHCLGYFTENPKEAEIEGVASYIIDSDLSEIITEQFYLFDEDFYSIDVSGKSDRKADKMLKSEINRFDDLVNEEIVQNEDGSMALIGEIQYSYTYTSGSGDNQTTKTKYVYGSIVVSNIDVNGEVTSNTQIKKSTTFSRPSPKHNLMISLNEDFYRITSCRRSDFEDADPNKNQKDKFLKVIKIDANGDQIEEALVEIQKAPNHNKTVIKGVDTDGIVLPNNDILLLVNHSKKEYKILLIKPL